MIEQNSVQVRTTQKGSGERKDSSACDGSFLDFQRTPCSVPEDHTPTSQDRASLTSFSFFLFFSFHSSCFPRTEGRRSCQRQEVNNSPDYFLPASLKFLFSPLSFLNCSLFSLFLQACFIILLPWFTLTIVSKKDPTKPKLTNPMFSSRKSFSSLFFPCEKSINI